MKKKIISAMAIMAMLFGPIQMQTTKAQIFLDDEEMIQNFRLDLTETWLPVVPELGETYDQYVPMGGEVLVLGLLGGAYLLGKKRKKE